MVGQSVEIKLHQFLACGRWLKWVKKTPKLKGCIQFILSKLCCLVSNFFVILSGNIYRFSILEGLVGLYNVIDVIRHTSYVILMYIRHAVNKVGLTTDLCKNFNIRLVLFYQIKTVKNFSPVYI